MLRYNARMPTKIAFHRLALGGLPLFVFFALSTGLFAQVNFYSAPLPPDISPTVANRDLPVTSPNVEVPGADAAPAPSRPFPFSFLDELPLQFTFAIREGYDDNLFTTRTNTDSSFYTNFSAGTNYSFGNSRLKLNASLGGGLSYYYTRPGNKMDYNAQFALDAVYLATPRLTLTLGTSTAYLSQPDLTIAGGTNRQDGDYIYSNSNLSAAYQWTEKFSTVTAYGFTVLYYMDNNLNDNQGRVDQLISQSGRWLILPKTTGIIEYRFKPSLYFNADLNTYNNFFLVGVDQAFSPRLKLTTRVGLEVGLDDNQTDGQSVYVGPYGESSLTYQFGPASFLAWTMRYGTEASGLDDVTQRQTFRTGLSVRHAFTPRISASLGANYQVNYYDQESVIEPFYENIFDFVASLDFKVNRVITLQAGYQFTADVAPQAIDREYTRNVVFAGANFGF